MKYLVTRDVELLFMTVGDRLRRIDEGWVEILAERMAEEGQKTPVEVVGTVGGGASRLVAGGHRVAAARRLGWKTIRAEVYETESAAPELEMALREIDENLVRQELNPLYRAVFLAERKRVYEELYPQAKHGGDRGNQHVGGRQTTIIGFCQQTAEKMRVSETTIKRAVRIATLLSPEVRDRIAGTHLADVEGDLYQLTRYSPEQQSVIVERCLGAVESGLAPAKARVAVAAAALEGKTARIKAPHEITTERLTETWRRGDARGRKAFLDFLKSIGVIDRYDSGQC